MDIRYIFHFGVFLRIWIYGNKQCRKGKRTRWRSKQIINSRGTWDWFATGRGVGAFLNSQISISKLQIIFNNQNNGINVKINREALNSESVNAYEFRKKVDKPWIGLLCTTCSWSNNNDWLKQVWDFEFRSLWFVCNLNFMTSEISIFWQHVVRKNGLRA